MAKRRLVPKGCVVHSIELTGRSAEVRYRCADDRGQKTYRRMLRGGGEVISNYPSKRLRGIRSVRLPGGIGVSGKGSVHGFMSCSRDHNEISCAPTRW